MNSNLKNKCSSCSVVVSLLLTTLLSLSSAAYATPKEFPAPNWLNKVQVNEKMIINGIPSLVHHFEAYKEIDELLEFYRKEWRDDASEYAGYREAQVAPWHIISRLANSYLYTVQVQQNGAFSIRGYLAIADLKAMKKPNYNDNQVPKMSGSTIVNDVTSFDPGKKGRTLMLVNQYSPASNSSFYRNHYLERGWANLMDTKSQDAFIMTFRKRNRETHLVINRFQNTTHVVMNIIEEL